MARRKRAKAKLGRTLWLLGALAVLAGAGWFAYRHWHALRTIAQDTPPAPHDTPPPEASRVTISGQLTVGAPVRDPQLGIAAPAAVLLRHVEMFEWIEQCHATHDGMQECTYAKGWSTPVDSSTFHTAHDHAGNPLRDGNPKAPFAEARFHAAQIMLDKLEVDAALIDAQLKPIDFPVHDKDLPPNMAATFTVRDGVLYAGGDPVQPVVGTVRISYRVIPSGAATLTGVRQGAHLTQ